MHNCEVLQSLPPPPVSYLVVCPSCGKEVWTFTPVGCNSYHLVSHGCNMDFAEIKMKWREVNAPGV